MKSNIKGLTLMVLSVLSFALIAATAVESTNPKRTILLNFGQDDSVQGWNTLSKYTSNSRIANLVDQAGEETGIALVLVERFNARNTNGPKTTQTDFNIPAVVSADSYYGNAKGTFNNKEVRRSVLRFEGLDPNKLYELCFFAGRLYAKENRDTDYILQGRDSKTVTLDAANNSAKVACATEIQPDSEGNIRITVTAGKNNDNPFGFYYLNAMRLTEVH